MELVKESLNEGMSPMERKAYNAVTDALGALRKLRKMPGMPSASKSLLRDIDLSLDAIDSYLING